MALGSIATAALSAEPAGVAAFLKDRQLTRVSIGYADLNGDRQPEALVYAMATRGGTADLCGSGGCNLYVVSFDANGYRLIADITLTRPPIRVLPATTHGWHDIGVWVAGGGAIAGHEARLRFDGTRYPANPTVAPATVSTDKAGDTVIATLPPTR